MPDVLFIDDHKTDRDFFESAFKSFPGLRVYAYANVALAKEDFDSRNYDLIVLDIHENGTETLAWLRDLREADVWTPACLYTVKDVDKIKEIMNGYNCLTMIEKGTNVHQVVDKVLDLLMLTSDDGIKRLDEIEELAMEVQEAFKKGQETLDASI